MLSGGLAKERGGGGVFEDGLIPQCILCFNIQSLRKV